MPVTVKKVDMEDPAQRADLEKIYADSPIWMRRDLSPGDFVEQWIIPCDSIWGGWFNGRILGAVGIRDTKDGQQLIGLCVREVTRRRGVALQMMEALLKELSGHVYIDTRQQPSTDILFDHLGFSKSDPAGSESGVTWVRWQKDLS